MSDLLNDSFEDGEAGLVASYVDSIYGGPRLHVTTAYAHHGIYSVKYISNYNISRDFTNPSPDADVYFWGYVYLDNPMVNISFPGNGNSIGIWELRHSYSLNYPDYVHFFLEALSTDTGSTYHWNLIAFHMDMPHRLGARVVDSRNIVPGHAYKVVTSYSHYLVGGAPWQTLKLWIDDLLIGTITEAKTDPTVNWFANSIFLGAPKAEWGGGLASGVYLDCIGIGYAYPLADYYSTIPTANFSINSSPVNVGFTINKIA